MSLLSPVGVLLREGALLRIDKPSGPTSHDVVHGVRRHLGVRRVGHAGTLDPQATGLLVIGVGPATRLLGFVAQQDKVYRGVLQLGTRTDSMDATGVVLEEKDWPKDRDSILAPIPDFLGTQQQRPPMVSAVKVGGQRLYRLAAKGVEVERASRSITIRRFEVGSVDLETGRVEFEIECSSGTYVRSIADEWGARIGSVAHLGSLRRTRVGAIEVDGAFPAARLARRGEHPAGQGAKRGGSAPDDWRDLSSARLSWDVALGHMPRRELDSRESDALTFGRAPRSNGERGILRLEDRERRLLAIAEGTPMGLPLSLRCVLVRRESPS